MHPSCTQITLIERKQYSPPPLIPRGSRRKSNVAETWLFRDWKRRARRFSPAAQDIRGKLIENVPSGMYSANHTLDKTVNSADCLICTLCRLGGTRLLKSSKRPRNFRDMCVCMRGETDRYTAKRQSKY